MIMVFDSWWVQRLLQLWSGLDFDVSDKAKQFVVRVQRNKH